MQYGVEIFPYKRFKEKIKEKKDNKQMNYIHVSKILIYFISSLLISRVLLLNIDNSTAPFGITFLIAMYVQKEKNNILPITIGGVAGYITIYNKVSDFPSYLIIIVTITALNYLLNRNSKTIKLSIIFIAIFTELLICEFIVRNLTLKIAFLTTFLQMLCILPLYFILERSIICIKELKTKHLFRSEEIISMAILISLIISGTWGMQIFQISLRNILALGFILILSYINGSTIGAASGIAIGTIIGISSNDILVFISVYGLCGFIAGIFKENGKWLSGFSYIITFLILKLYSNIGIEFKLVEVLIVVAIFFIVPNSIYKRINLELDWEKKQEYLNKNYVDKIKELLVQRLDNFSNVLYNVSNTLNDLADNEKLEMKNKSSALIENLADRVCSNCNMNNMCWKREAYYTYAAFGELIQNLQEGKKNQVPKEIDKKCIKRATLLNNGEDIVIKHVIKETWRKTIGEGRQILAGQINSMGDSLKEVINEFNSEIKIDSDSEKKIRKVLDSNRIKFNDVFCFLDKNNRLIVRLDLKSCGGTQLCAKKILPLINQVIDKSMCASDKGCSINPKTSECNILFEEMPKYHIASYVKRKCKSGEKYNGDSYVFGKSGDGDYMCVISDGMGSGPQAGQESKAVVELIEKFISSGFSKTMAINAINSIMSLKFSEDEKFTTLDLSGIDLYSGQINFMKVGAVASFIKSGKKVEVISSKTLPIGVLDKADVEIINKKVKNGDIIVMLSDGVVDYDSDNIGNVDWVVKYLKDSNSNNPKELVEGLIEKAKELSGGKVKDDMTAIVSKVYNLY
ncbi:stage II sporulation protein E [Clostridium aestuarii]|uniref:Stage II sporulation protein E n=1 Tax=Clostridium aestuarii TaxID=338193 RepID=A0ABT4D3A3_9CLOT|nr:stage II sporulation protein E [Clostridium aestuarii]MCY6485718.1 stage II sporulation protein E [Clostridium aestuarii]